MSSFISLHIVGRSDLIPKQFAHNAYEWNGKEMG